MFRMPPSIPTHLPYPRPTGTPRGGLHPSCHLLAQMCWASPCQLSPADVSPEPAGRRGSPGGAKRARGWNTKCSAVLQAVLPAGQSWGTRTCVDPRGQHTAAPASSASSALRFPLLGGVRPRTSLISCFPTSVYSRPVCTICSRASIVPQLKQLSSLRCVYSLDVFINSNPILSQRSSCQPARANRSHFLS